MIGKLTAIALRLFSRGEFSACLSELAYSTHFIIFYCQRHCKGKTLSSCGFFHYQLFACVWICRVENPTQKLTRAGVAAYQIFASQVPNWCSFHGNCISSSLADACCVPTKWQINNTDSIRLPLRGLIILSLSVHVFSVCLKDMAALCMLNQNAKCAGKMKKNQVTVLH